MRVVRMFVAVLSLMVIAESSALAGNYILYLQGRSMGSWNDELASASGWTNVTFAFDGSSKLNGPETNSVIYGAVRDMCSNGNNCVIHCYSTGCLRMLKVVADLRLRGHSLPGLLFSQASGSAAGGTKLAEISTQGLTGFIAKIIGQQEAADFDLTPSATRNRWAYIQDKMGANIYHLAGNKDVCISLLFFKICGGAFIPGVDDGVVGLDSASGASSSAGISNGCTAAKYPYRIWDSYVACGGADRNHLGLPGLGSKNMVQRMGSGSAVDRNRSWGDGGGGKSSCDRTVAWNGSNSSCDSPFANTGADFAASAGAANVDARSSNTVTSTAAGSCYGKCGGYAGNNCWCDAYGAYDGSACGDYTAANCQNFNNIRNPVYRAVNNGIRHFTTDVTSAVTFGAIEQSQAFYVHPTNQGGMGSLYSCKKSNGRTFLSPTSTCGGHSNQGRIGYNAVSNSGAYNTAKPLYEMYKSSIDNYIYTIDYNERTNLQSQGYTLTSIPGYVWAD